MKARIRNGESTPSTGELFLKQHSHAVEAINMSAQELADLESLYADGVLDEDEYKTKLAELKPAKERTLADELADLEALRNDGILDDDEYRAKLKELQDDDEPPAKKAKTEEEDYEALTVTCLLYTSPSPRDATLSRMPSSA